MYNWASNKFLHHLYHHYRLSIYHPVTPKVKHAVISTLQSREQAKSGESAEGSGEGTAFIESPTRPAHMTRPENPPSYGEQQRQDALWKGEQPSLIPTDKLTKKQVGIRRFLLRGISLTCGMIHIIKTTTCSWPHRTDLYPE
jgi:hypothetical protein